MKILNTRVCLLQILLVCLACGLAFLGLVFFEQEITFWPNNWGYIEHKQTQLPFVLGVVPFANCTFFLSYLALYLVFEFYGFKSSFYGLIGTIATLSFTYFLFMGLRWLNANEDVDFFPVSVIAFFDYDRFRLCLTLLTFAAGGFVAFALAALIRKITAGYFMFLRYPIASALGLSFFALSAAFLTASEAITPEGRLLQGATPAAQFIVGVVATLIPLYLIRMILGIFKGRGMELVAKTPDEENPDNKLPEQHADKTTVSQKVHRDRLAL